MSRLHHSFKHTQTGRSRLRGTTERNGSDNTTNTQASLCVCSTKIPSGQRSLVLAFLDELRRSPGSAFRRFGGVIDDRPAISDAHDPDVPLGLARTHAKMRTKQPIRSKRDHFMYLDCLESDHIEPVKMLVKPKAVTEVASSPTSIFAPMSAPPTMKLPEAVAKPRLPRASVWPHGENVPWPVRLVPPAAC